MTKPITEFYDETALGPVILVLIGALLIVPFNSIRLGLLRRKMQFGTLMYIEIASAAANAVVAIVLAYLGFGPVSLAWGVLASILATYVIYYFNTAETEIWPPSLKEWRSVTSFGTKAIGLGLLERTSDRSPEIIVGRISGMHDTGILSRAAGLIHLFSLMISQSVYSVIFPVVSERHRNGMAIGPDYIKMVSYVSVVAFPFFAFLFFLALPFIQLMFGPNWDESAPLAQVFCVTGFLAPYIVFNGAFYVAVGEITTDLKIAAVFTPLKVLCWLFVGTFGLLLALKLFVSIYIINVAVSLFYLQRAIKFSWAAFASASAKGLAILVPSAILALIVTKSDLIATYGNFLALSLAACAVFVVWLISIFLFRHPFRDELVYLAANLRSRINARYEDGGA